MKKTNKRRLIIRIVSLVISFTTSFILAFKMKEELDALPSREEDYLSNY